MNTSWRTRIVGLALPVGLLVVMAHTDAPIPLATSHIEHAGIKILRNNDGTIARGPLNQIESYNWAGYALFTAITGVPYTAAQLSWTVPWVSYVPPPSCQVASVCSSEYAASWVGIGGVVDTTLIQLGTTGIVSRNEATQYSAWYEMAPSGPVTIPYPVYPGDSMKASLTCRSNCTAGENQKWYLYMWNRTQGWVWFQEVEYTSSLASAEWILEAPVAVVESSEVILPLATFLPAAFVPTFNDNVPPKFSTEVTDGVDPILMLDPNGETANPSTADVAPPVGAFNVCWGYDVLVPCAAPVRLLGAVASD